MHPRLRRGTALSYLMLWPGLVAICLQKGSGRHGVAKPKVYLRHDAKRRQHDSKKLAHLATQAPAGVDLQKAVAAAVLRSSSTELLTFSLGTGASCGKLAFGMSWSALPWGLLMSRS